MNTVESRHDDYCKQENLVKDISANIVKLDSRVEKLDYRINGTLDKMSVHVEDSQYWRRFIVGVAISLVIAICGGITTAASIAYYLGQYAKQISVNTQRLDRMEGLFLERHNTNEVLNVAK